MNAPFDPGAVADDAVRQMEEGQGPLVLSVAAPLISARELIRRRYTQSGGRTIHHHQSVFYVWDGTHYRETERDEIRAVIYAFLDGAKRLNRDDQLVPFNPTRNKVSDVLEALAAEVQLPGAIRAPAWLDDGPNPEAVAILSCANGLLHLPTRTLLPHTPNFFSVNAVDYRYETLGQEPVVWLGFLRSIWGDDQESIDTLQELFGLLLTHDTSQQKMFLVVGPKRSGKGTIARTLRGLLGGANVVGPTLSTLTQNFGLASLIGKPLAIISDARLGGRTDASAVVERLLAITGEDTITVDRKYREPWTGRLPTRFLILTNELPRLTDASGALASRFIVLLLTRSFYGQEDLTLEGRILRECPDILHWALAGYDRLRARGHFVQPASAAQAAEELADLGSPVGAFVRERCVVNHFLCVECESTVCGMEGVVRGAASRPPWYHTDVRPRPASRSTNSGHHPRPRLENGQAASLLPGGGATAMMG